MKGLDQMTASGFFLQAKSVNFFIRTAGHSHGVVGSVSLQNTSPKVDRPTKG